jgi:protein-S-isoprenylcysteine O-methyltransferase Ste14
LPALGVAAAVFLVLYGTFLGTEGEGYRWMRRYGVAFYFGLTSIGMLVVSDRMRRHIHGGKLERGIAAVPLVLSALLPLLGLAHVLLPLWWSEPAARNALENATEWWGGAIFTVFFVVLAWAWHHMNFGLQLHSRGGRRDGEGG